MSTHTVWSGFVSGVFSRAEIPVLLLESGHVTVCKLSCARDIGMISLFWQAVEMALGMVLTYANYCIPSIGQDVPDLEARAI